MDSDDETDSNTSMPHWQASDIDHVIRHVTVRQLLEADQMHSTAPFKIEGKEFKKFILVANICFLDERETYLDIGLDDGTGRIKARQWNNPEVTFENGKSSSFQVSNFPYVRVVGELEQFKNRNLIKVMDIQPASSPYEPFYHVLHAIHDTLVHERGPPPTNTSGTMLQGVPESTGLDGGWGDTSSTEHILSTSSQAHRTPGKISDPSLNCALPSNHHEGSGSNSGGGSRGGSTPRKANMPDHHASPSGSNTQVQRLAEHTANMSLESPHSSQPPAVTSPSPRQPRRSSRKHDPYSNLTALQRDIILCIKTAATQRAQESLYPPVGSSQRRETTWEGLHLSVIITVMSVQHPGLSPEELHDAFEHLLDESYVFSPVDEEHFDCI